MDASPKTSNLLLVSGFQRVLYAGRIICYTNDKAAMAARWTDT